MRLLSPRELAEALGVSESSLKRWVDAGKISAMRTDGGHRRISVAEAVRYVRATGAPIAHPELLGLPEVAAAMEREAYGEDRLQVHLQAGDAVAARGWLMNRYLRGVSLAELCDGPVREAMHALGTLWHGGATGIFVEHRATDVCLQALAHLRASFEPPAGAPVALGGTPENDPYLVPTTMAALVTAAAGLRAVNLGADTPVSALAAAVDHHRPVLVWVSASAPLPPGRARALGEWIDSLPRATTIAIGGRASDALATSHRRARKLPTMAALSALAAKLAGGAD
ncbi:MAG TPA: helix-turn-helix domain-containing protein [Kofleriaceae bacterium]|nr:helix-turn-helix domain-containing protein [Kofleriaceae bacterium]